MTEKIYNLIIIGSGPAGYTAAIYAARADLAPLMIEGVNRGGVAGGQLMWTTEVENFPGFPEGIQGPELMELMKKQSVRFGTEIISEDVVKVDFSSQPLKMETGDGKTYLAHSVIIATGSSAKWLGLESENKLKGFGVSACATCDGAFFRDKKVVIVGGGDAAMEEANFLTKFAKEVTVLVRKGEVEVKASSIMYQRAKKNPKIKFLYNIEVVDIADPAQKKVTSVTLKNNIDNTTSEFPTEGVFVAIGHRPNTEVFAGQLNLDRVGYIEIKDGHKTNVEGVFAAGDVHDYFYRQAITAAGAGCQAALEAQRFLAEKEHQG
ncbi:MAG: thioredoxin-disulfide reductase [Candidatus Buchananbacteria bacterium]|nr:thioredoxin-disulfide reductase [Candidatus Buchananbacteria bacterium]